MCAASTYPRGPRALDETQHRSNSDDTRRQPAAQRRGRRAALQKGQRRAVRSQPRSMRPSRPALPTPSRSKSPPASTSSATAKRARSATRLTSRTGCPDSRGTIRGRRTSISRRTRSSARRLGACSGKQSFKRAGCVGADRARRSRGNADGPRQLARGARRPRRRRRSVHERGVAGRHLLVPIESLLRQPRSLRRRDRDGDETRVRRDRSRGLRAAARLPRSRDGAAYGVPGAQRKRISRSAPNTKSRR